jgi:hypothetical protein
VTTQTRSGVPAAAADLDRAMAAHPRRTRI